MLACHTSHFGAIQDWCLSAVKLYLLGVLTVLSGEACWLCLWAVFTSQALNGAPVHSHTAQAAHEHVGTASHPKQGCLRTWYYCGLIRSQSETTQQLRHSAHFNYFFHWGGMWQDRQFAWSPWGALFLLNSMWGRGVCAPGDNCHFYLDVQNIKLPLTIIKIWF